MISVKKENKGKTFSGNKTAHEISDDDLSGVVGGIGAVEMIEAEKSEIQTADGTAQPLGITPSSEVQIVIPSDNNGQDSEKQRKSGRIAVTPDKIF